ncbi:MAG: hypothetical protein ACTSRZ_09050 [Promethearchaeota archaeon]
MINKIISSDIKVDILNNNIEIKTNKINFKKFHNILTNIQNIFLNLFNIENAIRKILFDLSKLFNLEYIQLFVPSNILIKRNLNIIQYKKNYPDKNIYLNNLNYIIKDLLKKITKLDNRQDIISDLHIKKDSEKREFNILFKILNVNSLHIYYYIKEDIYYILLSPKEIINIEIDIINIIVDLLLREIQKTIELFQLNIDMLSNSNISGCIMDRKKNILYYSKLYEELFINIVNQNKLSANKDKCKMIDNFLDIFSNNNDLKDLFNKKIDELSNRKKIDFLSTCYTYDEQNSQNLKVFYNRFIPLKIKGKLLGFLHIVENRTNKYHECKKLLEQNVFYYNIQFGNIYLSEYYKDFENNYKFKKFIKEIYNIKLDINHILIGKNFDTNQSFQKYFKRIIILDIIFKKDIKDHLLNVIKNLNFNSILIISHIYLLCSKLSFNEMIQFIEKLKNIIYNKQIICIIFLNEDLIEERKRLILLNNFEYLKPQKTELIPSDLYEILSFIYKKNVEGHKICVKDLLNKFDISSPTLRKKLNFLINAKFLKVEVNGRNKFFKVTNKIFKHFDNLSFE